jgi:hypothetical protein
MPSKFSFLLFFPLFFPSLHFLFFAPYLVIVCYKRSLYHTLRHALYCGVIHDLFSASPLLGLTSLNYCLTVFILFPQRRNFFEENSSTLPLMTYLFSFLSTGINGLLLLFAGNAISPSFIGIFIGLFLMPLMDAAFALAFYSLPFKIYSKFSRLLSYDHFRKRHRPSD